ncbi:oligopeptide/dipeptide ABC transporter ATP-binding protein [Phytoactinopolyspora mesophila]|uniref:oligopeptide/dipeptide ABC transporter ATP-binding protein n=1 Tax=Phytoactinopolyspora mesophila TaxID=2650750 RepID=UPI001390EE38
MTALLQVRDLRVGFGGGVRALAGVDLDVDRGESVAVVGESGAGKSTLALALTGLSDAPVISGSICLDGDELVGAPADRWRLMRGDRIGLAVQGSPLNPVLTLFDQIAEPLRERRGLRRRECDERVHALLEEVQLGPEVLDRYPHEVSGGQRRRAALAMALALDPDLLVLDEPTGGLDTVTAAQLSAAISGLVRERGIGLVMITHALSEAARLADRTLVLYAGQTLETGPSRFVLGDPRHPYTRDLVAAYPVMSTTRDLRPIRGTAPDPRALPAGCPFHPRCAQAVEQCRDTPVSLASPAGVPELALRRVACHLGGVVTVLEARGVSKTFGSRRAKTGLREASLELRSGEAVGVVGRSGSGKSTLARILAGHLRSETGELYLHGQPFNQGRRREDRLLRSQVQLIQQDPWEALSPRMTVAELLAEPLVLQGREHEAAEELPLALRSVGLPGSAGMLGSRTHQISGGQLQRLCVARALLARPCVIVADEPTSMLDPSEQARLLLTLRERQSELGLALVLVSHDMALVRKATDRLLVIDDGRVVEHGQTETVCHSPRTDTAKRLIMAAPSLPITHNTHDTQHRRDTFDTDHIDHTGRISPAGERQAHR